MEENMRRPLIWALESQTGDLSNGKPELAGVETAKWRPISGSIARKASAVPQPLYPLWCLASGMKYLRR